jgi:hypothetical protein
MNVNRQTRIFVPRNQLFDHDQWAETVIGRIILPIICNADYLIWYWFSRYDCPKEVDSGDCDINQIPMEFMNLDSQHYRSVRFRYSLEESLVGNFERYCLKLIQDSGCAISDFRDYDFIGDLGSDRHLGGERSSNRRRGRAELVVSLYHATSRLVLDALIGPDEQGRYSLEYNDSNQNPLHSTFESLHHVFCNITDVPLRVLVSPQSIGTDWNPPHALQAYRVKF